MRLIVDGTYRYIGPWRGFVSRVDDPQSQFRIKATVPEVLDDVESNWALPCFPGSSKKPALPEIGQMVWIEFEQGDPNKPIWKGSTPSSFQGDLPVSKESQGLDGDEVQPPRGTGTTVTETGKTVNEPVPAFVGEYPSVSSYKTKSGHIIDIDDTDGEERLAVIHKVGASLEMDSAGSFRQRVNRKDVFNAGDEVQRIKGKHIIIRDGTLEEENRRDVIKTTLGKLVATYGSDVEVELNGPKLVVNVNGSSEEFVAGRKVVKVGGNLQESVVGSIQVGASGARQTIITENDIEYISNLSQGVNGKESTIVLGSCQLNVMQGRLIMNALAGVYIGGLFIRGLLPVPGIGVSPIPTPTEALVRGVAFQALFNALVTMINSHVHTSAAPGSPTTAPLVPFNQLMTPGIHLSTEAFIP